MKLYLIGLANVVEAIDGTTNMVKYK